ncbi:MAG TPA: hypothetical protein VEF07_02240, partial [Candidatus Binataceae bacterium]|nr:hypothetical protein [Candidatus Binataceae bacterium]
MSDLKAAFESREPAPPESIARFKREKRSAVVGYEAMKRYGWHPGQQVILRGSFNGQSIRMPFIIEGVVPDQLYPNVSFTTAIALSVLAGTVPVTGALRIDPA